MTQKEISEFIYKLIKLLKPEFYNKITWAVVIAGIALLSSTLIDKIISALFEVSFQIKLTDSNDVVIGILLIIIGLGYHLAIKKMDAGEVLKEKNIDKENRIKHDIEVFRKSEDVLDEVKFKFILDWVTTDHSYETEQVNLLDNYYFHCREYSNLYLNYHINESKNKFLKQLDSLREFISYNFFVYPNDQIKAKRYCMHPEKNIDRGGNSFSEFYDNKTDELEKTINDTYTAYVAFRKEIKSCLYI